MTPESTQTAPNAKSKARTFDSLKAAASALKLPMRVIQGAKTAGCTAFRSNRVYESELLTWLEAHPETFVSAANDPKGELTFEQIRKLRIANDAKEGRLVERAWVAARMQQAAAELNNLRAKWEAEMPLRFAAAAGDVVECRAVLRVIMDEIMAGMQSLAKHFEEDAS